jgi:CBS domain-containing protein
MEIYSLPQIKVREIMTEKVMTVDKGETIEELIKTFKKHDFHSFPVLHREGLVGVVTKTDLLRVIDDKKLSNIAVNHVEDIMTPHPTSISPESLLSDGASIMQKNHIRILPVVEEGKLVGLLSYSDLVRTVFKG